MFQLVSALILCIFITPSWAAKVFTKNDLIGSESICEKYKEIQICDTDKDQLEQSAGSLDDYLAMAELRRNIEAMASSQVQSSLQLLQIMGMQRPGMVLDRQLQSLKLNGIDPQINNGPIQPELVQKYIIAAMRYHELKTLYSANRFQGMDKAHVQKKLKLLELRFPLISNHHFGLLKDSLCSELKMSCRPEFETSEENSALDQYLFQDNAELKLNGPHSYTGKIASQTFSKAQQENLLGELQASLANQINPLLNLKSLKECNLLNLHSRISLQVINSSANPDRLFGKYCSCQTSEDVIDPNIVTGLEMASLGGLGLCLTPTGVGQVLGCPTAAIAGLGATAANGIVMFDKIDKFQTVSEQKNIVAFLDRTNLNKEEEQYLKNKELQSIKEAGISGMIGLIGFGVGNIGMKGLIKYFHKGRVSESAKHLNEAEKVLLDEAVSELDLKNQTKAFVLLEKIDSESREVLMKRPMLLVKEIKKGGKSCDL